MTTEIVLSPIEDEKMNSHINESEVWKNAYFPDEITEDIRLKYNHWYEYNVKFDGLTPIQMTKFREI